MAALYGVIVLATHSYRDVQIRYSENHTPASAVLEEEWVQQGDGRWVVYRPAESGCSEKQDGMSAVLEKGRVPGWERRGVGCQLAALSYPLILNRCSEDRSWD